MYFVIKCFIACPISPKLIVRLQRTTLLHWKLICLFAIGLFPDQIWQIWNSACITETVIHRLMIRLVSTLWRRKRTVVQVLELFASVKVIWINIAILKIGLYQRKLCPLIETSVTIVPFIFYTKISSTSTPWSRKRIPVRLLEVAPVATFHVQTWKFW